MLNLVTKRQLPTLLLIDDDMVSREVVATVLTMGGYTVHTAAGGEAALEQLARGGCVPDAILMDAQMPGLSGVPLIAELRARSQAIIVAISASVAPPEVTAAIDGFLLKPFGAEELGRLLDEHASQASLAAEQASLNSGEVVNPKTLAQLRQLMPEAAVREIYAAVVADLTRRLAALEAALAAGDMAETRRIGHAIKGGCGMAGAVQAARLGARFEALGTSQGGNDLGDGGRLLADLRTAALSLKRMLEAEFPA